MFQAMPQPSHLQETMQILAWRVMLHVTRLVHRLSTRWVPVLLPVLPLMWVPPLALMFGALLGWSLVR